MLWQVDYYDGLGRLLQSYKQHNQGGGATLNAANYDLAANTYDFTNAILTTNRKHYNAAISTSAPAVTIANTYDHMGRKRQTQESINGGINVVVSQLDYNEIGHLLTKHLHSENSGSSFLQNIPYAYNERGWLRTAGSGTLFTEDLRYNTPDNGISQQYNGNISEMLYSKTSVSAGITASYNYDQLNRLTNAASNDNLTEQVSYDLMGNITALTRGGTSSATLAYTYLNGNGNSNQLATVTSSGSAFRNYAYDANGNATSDGTTKSISYNLLNLPQTVIQSSTTLATYTYDATGTKIRNTGSDGYWDYIDGIVYNGTTAANNTIQFIQTEEGRVLNQSGTWHYEYNLKDHLGNVRVSFDKDPSAGTARRIQEDEYYAFGLRAPFYNYSNNNRYLYNGKEIQTDLVNQYDYGARFYDPVVARWTTPDKLSEHPDQIDKSSYTYVWDNPVVHDDPDGNCPVCPILIPIVEGIADLFTVEAVTATVVTASAAGTAIIITHAHSGSNPVMQQDATRTNSPVPDKPAIVQSAKGANKLMPNTSAGGDHSSFKVDKNGKIVGTATYEKNPKNPSGFQEKKRVDVEGGDHYDKQTGQKIPTPHVHEGDKTRPAEPSDLPQQTPPKPPAQNNQTPSSN